MRNSLRPPPPSSQDAEPVSTEDRVSSLPGERHLNALDDAITLLSTLQQQNPPRSKRRGRLDVAALLYDLAPNIKLSIEPGAGTEVIGDEHELRRMFHLLLNQSTGGSAEGTTLNSIDIRRQDDSIHISVELGPDTAATSDLERRWLSRMAHKHGGHLELRGRKQIVVLPAETSKQEEVDQLKRELHQAQLLGEAYAKELASALSNELSTPPIARASSTPSPRHWSDPVCALARVLLPTLQAVARTSSPSPTVDALEGWVRQLSLATQTDDTSLPLEVSHVIAHVLEAAIPAANKRNIRLSDASPAAGLRLNAPTQTLSSLLSLLVEHAIAATPTGGLVTVSAARSESDLEIVITDQGAAVPESLSAELLHGSIDPRSVGRPAGGALILAAAIGERIGAQLNISSNPEHTRVSVTFN